MRKLLSSNSAMMRYGRRVHLLRLYQTRRDLPISPHRKRRVLLHQLCRQRRRYKRVHKLKRGEICESAKM
jgi:hypothetical protein